mgnify:CR=1 FL=1
MGKFYTTLNNESSENIIIKIKMKIGFFGGLIAFAILASDHASQAVKIVETFSELEDFLNAAQFDANAEVKAHQARQKMKSE